MFRIISVILIVFTFLQFGCSDQFKTKEELLNQGLKSIEKNDPNSAIIFFKKALEKDQNFFEARFQLAKAYIKTGKLDSAEKELQKLIRQNPRSKEVHIELARVYIHKENPDNALQELSTHVGDISKNVDALEIAGWAHALKGDTSTAIELLKKAIAEGNGKTSSRIALARVYERMGKTDEAKSQIAEILTTEPSSKIGLYTLAEIQTKQNDKDAAIKTYDQILGYYPTEVEAFFKKGVLYLEIGKNEEALSVSDNLIKVFPKRPEGYRLKGIVLFYKKNFNDSTIVLQKSLSLQPHIITFYFLGLNHYYKNEYEQAMNQLQKALDINPSFTQARILTSLIHLKKNRTDDAIKEIKKVFETDENNAIAHNILGSAFMAKGLYTDGIEEFNRAIENDPKLSDVYIKKSLFDLSKGKFKEAEIELKKAISMNPDMLNSRVILAFTYVKQNAYDKALIILKEGLKDQQTDAIFYYLMADVLLRQNKVPDAIKYLQKSKETNPAYYDAYFTLASLYFQRGEHDKGLQELKSILKQSPDNVKAAVAVASILEMKANDEALKYYLQAKETGKLEGYLELAKFHLRKKEPEKALKVLDEASRKYPSEPASYELKGKTLLSMKRSDEAIKTFEEIEKINQKLGLAYIVNAFISMKKPDKALDRLKREMKKNPDNLELMAEISRIYKVMGKKQDSIDNARQIIQKNPASPIGYLTLAMIYQDDKELDKAIEILKKASQINDVSICMMIGNVYFQKKDYKAALEEYRKAESLKSGYLPALFHQGSVLHTMGRKKEAILEYQKALSLSQNHIPTLNNLAYLYAEDNKNLAMALQLAAKAYTLAPKDGYVQDTLGFVLLKNGKIKEGLTALKKAVELVPNNPSIYYHLALAYKESGEKQKAIENLQKAMTFGDFPEASNAKQLLGKLQKS
ncbi:MAG: XrtA/PEP-CTERM system TPR-repeat protein PrsT [Thermodesulfovibrionales bacterium]